tara:strand:- start:2737 stop:4839 length:2103 start_codon:yes stop_codon:yes gene_type:complete
MSYVICSNIENEDIINIGGYSQPASFQNNFRSPLILEVDSEIAVESVKIQRSNEWEIKKDNNFFLYFGEEQTTSKPSGDVGKNGVRIVLLPGSYNVGEMAVELSRAINASPISPEIFGSASVSTTTTATGVFNGFEFAFDPHRIGGDIAIVDGTTTPGSQPAGAFLAPTDFEDGNMETIKRTADSGAPAFTFTPHLTAGPVRAKVQQVGPALLNKFGKPARNQMLSRCVVRQRGNPLSAVKGEWITQFRTGLAEPASFCLGLSRPTTPYVRNGFPSLMTGYNADNSVGSKRLAFMDYWVQFDAPPAAPAPLPANGGTIRVFEWGQNANRNFTVKEILYKDAPNADVAAGGAAWDLALLDAQAIDSVVFQLDGNELKIYLMRSDRGTRYHLVDSAITLDTDKRWNFPQMGNATEALFPVYVLSTQLQEIEITKYNATNLVAKGYKQISQTNKNLGIGGPTLNYPVGNSSGGGPGAAAIVPGSDWFSNIQASASTFAELIFNMERPCLVVARGAAAGTYPPYTNATTVLPFLPVLILGEEPADPPRGVGDVSDYLRPFYVIPIPGNTPNMSSSLGFGSFPVAGPIQFASNVGTLLKLTSIEAGKYSVHSAFIRVNDLPIQSYNGATSSRSNILYHIPKFSNDGKQTGELFFNAPEKTYIRLNNTDTLMLNQLKVDVVSRNERIVEDLRGATIVCFHIRKAIR